MVSLSFYKSRFLGMNWLHYIGSLASYFPEVSEILPHFRDISVVLERKRKNHGNIPWFLPSYVHIKQFI